MSDRLLSERLKELEAEGLVVRTVIPGTPVRVEYHLTEKGRALADVVVAVTDWAHDWLAPAEAAVGARELGRLVRPARARGMIGDDATPWPGDDRLAGQRGRRRGR